jgi:hypothetical protein
MEMKDVVEIVQLLNKPKAKKSVVPQDFGVKIVVLQRGWVAVGRYVQTGEYVTLTNAAIIRRWGTTEGLPELAFKGPLPDTKLDESPEIRFHILTEIFSIKCKDEKWLGKL